ncbi:hypothetical protein IPJ63_03760 [Candidatus Nomurabacteria bacterium]|nr:MAG: hypothetical protein IPJ63_03760 [Candidatus Nomurabacteria bacterium]
MKNGLLKINIGLMILWIAESLSFTFLLAKQDELGDLVRLLFLALISLLVLTIIFSLTGVIKFLINYVRKTENVGRIKEDITLMAVSTVNCVFAVAGIILLFSVGS